MSQDLLNHLGTTLLLLLDEYTMNLSLQPCLLARVFITKSSKFRRAGQELMLLKREGERQEPSEIMRYLFLSPYQLLYYSLNTVEKFYRKKFKLKKVNTI